MYSLDGFSLNQYPKCGHRKPLLELPIDLADVAKLCLGCSSEALAAWLDQHPGEFPPRYRRIRQGRGKRHRVRILFPSEVISIQAKVFNPLYAKAGELPFPPPCPWCWGSGRDIRQAPRMKKEMRKYMELKRGKVA